MDIVASSEVDGAEIYNINSKMHHPYQCLAVARRNSGDILVVALGPNVLAFDVEAGHLLSQWPEEHASKVHTYTLCEEIE